jgi:hypothetical protein
VSYALGQPVPLQAPTVRDAAGAPANATAAAVTVTAPDGTTSAPSVTNPSAGVYTATYTPAAVGLHAVRWVFTGTNAGAPALDSFHVDQQLPPLVSLAEMRRQARGANTADDEQLRWFVQVASSQAERRTQIWRRQTRTKTADGGARFVRLAAPVLQITSVTEGGTAVASTGWTLDADKGWLYRGPSTSSGMTWAAGTQSVVVTYVAGPADGVVPAEIRQGVLLLAEHLWNTQRGGSGLPRQAGGPDLTLPVGFTIPRAVLEQWDPWIPELVA